MVIVSGNIDLSVGSVLGFAGGIAAYSLTVMDYGLPAAIILAAIVVGVLIGTVSGRSDGVSQYSGVHRYAWAVCSRGVGR